MLHRSESRLSHLLGWLPGTCDLLGSERVLVRADGFNSVAKNVRTVKTLKAVAVSGGDQDVH
jgi:hypothetical protein